MYISSAVEFAWCYRVWQSTEAQQLIYCVPVALLIATVMPLLGCLYLVPLLICERQPIDIEIIFDASDGDVKCGPASHPQDCTLSILLLIAITMRSREPRYSKAECCIWLGKTIIMPGSELKSMLLFEER